MRLRAAPDDFVLVKPSNPESDDSGMTCYQTAAKRSSWWFCKQCGVRCFTSRAPSETTEVAVPLESLKKLGMRDEVEEGDVVTMPAWKLKKDGFAEAPQGQNYFSVNVVTLDPHQELLDRAAWHENGWVQYVDSLGTEKGFRGGKPFPHGIY